MAQELPADRLAAGEEALARCEWEAAKVLFEAAVAEAPDDPRALDGLGRALDWLGETRAARQARERAYVEHRRRGDPRRAGAAALAVAIDYRLSGAHEAASSGWLTRAGRCLEGLDACSEHGSLEIERAKRTPDPAVAERHARRAEELARELHDTDLEIRAVAQTGVVLVSSGRWEDGMALLDEAMAVAMGGEASDPGAIGDTCCQTLVACDQIADLKRASEWCRVVVEFVDRRRYTPLRAWCRSVYAGVLVSMGEWARAEAELLDALRTYDSLGGIGSRIMALARLADLRLRQGRPEEAERLLAGCEEHPLAVVPVAALRLQAGEPATAAALLERRLQALPAHAPGASSLLPLLVEVRLAEVNVDAAADVTERLQDLAERLRRENLRALAELACGRLALARGDRGAGLSRLELALDTFVRLGMPFDEACTRLSLATAFVAERPQLAVEEARHALALFERLGAARGADEAASLLRSLGASGRSVGKQRGELTKREREVLLLLAEGLSNAEIAGRLVISEKTAGHHVSRIFRKLDVRNRAEAAAYAVRQEPAGTEP